MTTIDVEAISLPDTSQAIDLSNATPMSLEEAEAGWTRVNLAMGYVQLQLLELCRRKAWQAYVDEDGNQLYSSWRECAVDKMKMSQSRVYQLIEAAEVQSRLLEAGVENSKILEIPESHIRTIAQAPESKQLEAFECLMGWQEEGKITQQDAEAALLTVDTNKRYNRAEKLVADYISSNRDAGVSSAEPILEWAKEKKGLSLRQAEVLKDDVEVFVQQGDRTPSSSTPPKLTLPASSSAPPTPPPKPDKSLEIASVLNSYEPEDVAIAIATLMDEEYRVQLLVAILPSISPVEIAQTMKKIGLTQEQAKKISDACYDLTGEIDEAFGIKT